MEPHWYFLSKSRLPTLQVPRAEIMIHGLLHANRLATRQQQSSRAKQCFTAVHQQQILRAEQQRAKQQCKAVHQTQILRAERSKAEQRAAESKAEQFFSAAAGARHQQPRQHALITFCSCPPSYHQVFKVQMMISEQLLFF